jgi:hypothetical protein
MKRNFIILLFGIVLLPIFCNASSLKEMPPYINVLGVDEDKHSINKIITNNEVIVEIKDKSNGQIYSWNFEREKLGEYVTLDFRIDFTSKNEEQINKIVGDIDKTIISFKHHGDLPSNATIKVYVGNKYKDGKRLHLYYYNEEKNKVDYLGDNVKVKNGYAEFKIKHCSEYFLTGAIANDVVDNPKNMNYIIVGMVVVIFILIGITIFSTKK